MGFIPFARTDLVEKSQVEIRLGFFLTMGYKKDILGSFAYDFELSHKNEILASARTKSANADEIFGFASDEIKSTHPPSRRISPNEVGFHRRRRFHPPARVDLVEKSQVEFRLGFFLTGAQRIELWAYGFGDRRSTS